MIIYYIIIDYFYINFNKFHIFFGLLRKNLFVRRHGRQMFRATVFTVSDAICSDYVFSSFFLLFTKFQIGIFNIHTSASELYHVRAMV